MHVVAHGVDLVEIRRIERIWREHGERFLQRVYAPDELRFCLDHRTPALRLAGRFGVKEAVLKCLGTGWRGGIEWSEIETLADPLGRPLTTLSGRAAELAGALAIRTWLVSISHAGEYVMASAIALG